MLLPPKRPGQKRYSVTYESRPSVTAHEFVWAKDEQEARATFKKYIGKLEIINIVQR
jgi:hypothetical protein